MGDEWKLDMVKGTNSGVGKQATREPQNLKHKNYGRILVTESHE